MAYPGYLGLLRSGELKERAEKAVAALEDCRVCAHECCVNRLEGETGICNSGRKAKVSSYFPHMGEEDPLRGFRGSGTIFFSHGNLHCVFCQNAEISHGEEGEQVEPKHLAKMMLKLQKKGCHNINFVTPSFVVPQLLEALVIAAEQGLDLPLVYNTGGYDSLETLKWLDGVVDIYMPDFKFWDPEKSKKYLDTDTYPEVARKAFTEMHDQVGDLILDDEDLAARGLLVRHLVMPGCLDDTKEILGFLASLSKDTYVNVMDQYRPSCTVGMNRYPEINRRIKPEELEQAYQHGKDAGLHRFDERKSLFMF
jgi:putative pyruvate formate lyase activating enzyme